MTLDKRQKWFRLRKAARDGANQRVGGERAREVVEGSRRLGSKRGMDLVKISKKVDENRAEPKPTRVLCEVLLIQVEQAGPSEPNEVVV